MASPKICWVCCPLSRSVFRPLLGLNVRNYREFRTSLVYGETCSYYFLRLLPLHLGCLQFIFTWICPHFLAPFLVSLLSFLLSKLPSLPPTLCTPFCNTRHSLMSRQFYSPYKPSDNRCNYFSLQGENSATRAKHVLKGSAICLYVCT